MTASVAAPTRVAVALLAPRRAARSRRQYPDKPITFVVPFAAGSATDQLARALGQAITDADEAGGRRRQQGRRERLHRRAAGRARRAADGYTVLITTNTTHAANEHLYKKLPYDPVKDFAPVTLLGKGGQIMVVNPSSPAKTRRRIHRARRRRSRASSASAAAARRAASPASCFKQMARHRAPARAVQEQPARGHRPARRPDRHDDHRHRDRPAAGEGAASCARSACRRASASPLAPDVPTIDEAGVKGYEMGYWFAAYVPAKTPPAVVKRLHELLVAGDEERGREGVLREHRHRAVDDDARGAREVPGGRSRRSGAHHQGGRHRARVIVHLIDGTYELFRHFYGLRRFTKGKDRPFGAVVGVLQSVLQMIEQGATHVGVATDHVIESFRNDLWPGYKTGEGIEPALLRAVPSARGRARGDGRRRLADGRARGRRRARVGGAISPTPTRASRRSASGRPTRTSRSASAAIASCRSTGAARRSATRPACARSSASSRR